MARSLPSGLWLIVVACSSPPARTPKPSEGGREAAFAAAGVTAGADHACAWDGPGRVHCWGRNDRGQLGDGSTTHRARPVMVVGLGPVAGVSAGADHTCALLKTGEVACWGEGRAGQLGSGRVQSVVSPALVPGLRAVSEIAAGNRHTCVRTAGKKVLCWGRLGAEEPSLVAREVPALAGSDRLVSGADVACGLPAAGHPTCWPPGVQELPQARVMALALPVAPLVYQSGGCGGQGCYSQSVSGRHACAVSDDTSVLCAGNDAFGQTRARGIAGATAVAVTSSSSCALTAEGAVWCWGDNGQGLRGHGGWQQANERPTRAQLPSVKQIVGGKSHLCAVARSGHVLCWGDNRFGQLGNGTSPDLANRTAVHLGSWNDVRQLAMVREHGCLLRRGGRVGCWGANRYGETGRGIASAPGDRVGYREILSEVDEIAVGSTHACARHRGGTVSCFGFNRYGQLGNGTTVDSSTPVNVKGLRDAVSLAAGDNGTCAVRSNGTIVCWGENSDGALGQPPETAVMVPRLLAGVRNAFAVSLGEDHGCALVDGGAVLCWGATWPAGLLGCGEESCGHGPVRVDGIDDGKQLSIVGRTSSVLRGDGSVSWWGKDRWRWSERDTQMSPYPAPGLSGISVLSAPCALSRDGTAKCWGELAMPASDGGRENARMPAVARPIPGLEAATGLAAGGELACALRDGAFWCWGDDAVVGGLAIDSAALPTPAAL